MKLAAVALLVLSLQPAGADPVPCAPDRLMLDRLAARFHEFVAMTGSSSERRLIVTMSNSGTFSVLLTDGKTACMILSGDKAEIDNGT